MLIANLQANPAVAPEQDEALSRCHTPGGVWIRYPSRYQGMNPPICADLPAGSVIQYLNFEDSDDYCGSDNMQLVRALALNTSSGKSKSHN